MAVNLLGESDGKLRSAEAEARQEFRLPKHLQVPRPVLEFVQT